MKILEINDLSVNYLTKMNKIKAINKISLSIKKQEILGIIGESGSGKTTLANAILHLLPNNAEVFGKIYFNGIILSPQIIPLYYGKIISFIFQNIYSSLSENFTIKSQFHYLLKSNSNLKKKERNQKILNILQELGFNNPNEILSKYPFQLSGGMLQRIIVAMAISSEPALLIADEPTSAIDENLKIKLLKILNMLKEKKELTILLISHDLSLVIDFCDTIAIMLNGEIVEKGKKYDILTNAMHPYTKLLFKSKPDFKKKNLTERKIINTDIVNSPCKYYPWCPIAIEQCKYEIKEYLCDEHLIKCNNINC